MILTKFANHLGQQLRLHTKDDKDRPLALTIQYAEDPMGMTYRFELTEWQADRLAERIQIHLQEGDTA